MIFIADNWPGRSAVYMTLHAELSLLLGIAGVAMRPHPTAPSWQ